MTTTRRHKKNLIVSYKKLSDDLKELFRETYPDGYTSHLTKFVKPGGEPIFIVPLETDDTSYMIKFDVRIDPMGDDLDKALFDDDGDEEKSEEFAPLSEAIEKEEGTQHRERVLRHGDFENEMADEERRKKISLDIDKEDIKAALGEADADELDSYEVLDGDDGPDEEYEPSDDDLRGIEAEYLDAEIPPLDATIPEEEQPAKPKKKTTAKKKTK
ncbi:MAG: hypothetical protein IJ760_06740 [Bacteroidales bacterium]|nr:hypothetical protein [Bacteroidales bacterium]